MSSSASVDPADPERRRRRGRLTALALLAVALAPVVAAVVAYLFWNPASVNYGELIPPQPISDVRGTTADGRPFALSDLKGRWVLLHAAGGRCDEPCVKQHFILRQVRLMQNRHMERIERVWLVPDDAALDARLVEAYAGMHVVRVNSGALKRFPAEGDVRRHIYLVDPLGNLMMRFPADPDPKGMHRDLGRLLRASRVG
jgi:hypothetical protein